MTVQGVSGATTHNYEVPFDVGDYSIAGTQTVSADPGGQATASLTLTSMDEYSGQVNATCDASALAGTQCTLSPGNPIAFSSSSAANLTASLNVTNNAAPGSYKIYINTQDTSGSPSHTWTISLNVAQDFTISSPTPSSQTVTPGESATYNFNVFPVGASFTGTVSFTCSGAPAPCAFTPSSVTPANNSAAVVMTINTTASSSSLYRLRPGGTTIFYALWLALPALALLGTSRSRRQRIKRLPIPSLLALLLLALLLNSCGGGGTNGGGGGGGGGSSTGAEKGTQPGTYTIRVTGTAGSVSHQSPPVTLIVSAQ